jgi:hypothetical protein
MKTWVRFTLKASLNKLKDEFAAEAFPNEVHVAAIPMPPIPGPFPGKNYIYIG